MNQLFRTKISALLIVAAVAVAPLMHTATRAQTTVIKPNTNKNVSYGEGALFPHFLLDNALSKTVDGNGNVNYADLKGNKDLETYVQLVSNADLSKFPVLQVADKRPGAKEGAKRESRDFELVFWINAHNAYVLKTIADAWPISHLSDIKDFDSAKTRVIAGQPYSFREIREKVAKFDPRALFALTNGTKGGPLMQPTAYRYITINSSLERAVQTFVSDARNFNINRINAKVRLNEFFKDINSYFTTKKNDTKRLEGLRSVLSLYSARGGDRNYFTTNDYTIEFAPADKNLNAQGR